MRNNKRLNLALIWTVMVCISGCSQQPLSYATINESAAKGDLADVKRHLKRGAALNAVDVIGNTPLMCAAENGQLDVVQYLVSQGAEIDATNQMVMDEGMLTGRRNLNGCTPLMYASVNGHREIVQYLLTKGANVSAVDGGGQSALWHALKANHMAVVGCLVDNGANVNAKNHKGRTPLWHALEQGQQDVAVDLVKLGADIVTSDKGGDTPLWYAARRGYRDVANLIGEKAAENGTDVGARFLLRRLEELNTQSENTRDRFPPEYEPLMQAMASLDWPGASNAMKNIRSEMESSPSIPQNVLEIYGALEQFATWNPSLIQAYGEAIASSISTDAIYFGGTDPGRFVLTAFQEAQDLPFYVITQNALADNTYLDLLRQRIGDKIWLPSLEDSNEAFRKYVDDAQAGRIQAGADVKIEDGKVSVQGVGGVMTINGIISELLFIANKAKHEFFIEESYVIQWMYPYLEPIGLIMKLNSEPCEITPDVVSRDREYWDECVRRLKGNDAFTHDEAAQKAYSKLRSAIAGMYEYRRMYDEAEYAFKQSIDLYPLSPEANFRLAQMYMNMQRFAEAEEQIRLFIKRDPSNVSAKEFLGQIENTRRMTDRRIDIERRQQETGTLSPDEALELVSIYRAAGMHNAYQNLATRLVSDPSLPKQHVLALAGIFAQDQRVEAMVFALEQYTTSDDSNVDVWLDLAAAYAFLQREADAIRAARRAIELTGDQAREVILRDPRFQPLTTNVQFKALFPDQTVLGTGHGHSAP